MSLPSKYRSHKERSLRPIFYNKPLIIAGIAIAVTIYIAFLLSVEKYGDAYLSLWMVENILIFVGLIALFLSVVLIPWYIITKKFGGVIQMNLNLTTTEYLILQFAVIAGTVFAILGLGILISLFYFPNP